MKFLLDEKGQAEIIGVILIISIIVIAFSLIQSGMVPQWNQETEYKHYLEVNDDMKKLFGVMERVSAQGHTESAEIKLGTTYQERGPLINPPPATGTIQTYDTNITINNAIAKQSDAQCKWNGTEIKYNNKGLMYTPNYNYQEGTPPIHIEHSNLIIGYEENPEITKQNLIGDNKINIMNLKGDHESSGYTLESLGIYPKSAPPNTVAMESTEQENITITLQTKTPQAYNNTLEQKDTVSNVTINEQEQEVTITLTEGTYYFKTTALSINEDTSPDPEYIMTYDHDRNHTPPTTIQVEVRDQYNNPLPGQQVNFKIHSIQNDDPTGQPNDDKEDYVTIYNNWTETDEKGIAKTLVTVDTEEIEDSVIFIEATAYGADCHTNYNNIIIGDPEWEDIEKPEPLDWMLNIESIEFEPNDKFEIIGLWHDRDESFSGDTLVEVDVAIDDEIYTTSLDVSEFDEFDEFEDGWVEGEENGLDRVFDREDDFGEEDIKFNKGQVDWIKVSIEETSVIEEI
ncbi:Ig-like domain-containing protein [Methanonatronarchaeum sp. AMET-Sl]|uniref:Ig-like domain-containing protein n=1 Tax=Methanonatronarchaeum sp. AMET-Sl TaxID=3037654 RepID=UPI00244DA6C9|nr:Ig-like domain-containing protein [Methanonatronarchaeum sp. AMET-Sl]WGI18054.1 Ig-like domain-containing protein [Methanonatronarchaeum sp. AMET-Sl]